MSTMKFLQSKMNILIPKVNILHLKQTWAMVKFWANVNYFEEPMSIANVNVES